MKNKGLRCLCKVKNRMKGFGGLKNCTLCETKTYERETLEDEVIKDTMVKEERKEDEKTSETSE